MASQQDAGAARKMAPLTAAADEAAARLLTGCGLGGETGDAAKWLAGLRATDGVDLVGLTVGDELVGLSATRRTGMTMELTVLAVAAAHRRRGHGKELLIETLVRAGRRPTVTEVGEEELAFYRAMRFKPVGRRRQPDGSFRYRLGWHPPGQRTAPADSTESTDSV